MKGLPTRSVSPGWQLPISLGAIVASFCLANLLGLLFVPAGFHLSLNEVRQLATDPSQVPNGWAALMTFESINQLGLGVGALLAPVLLGQPVAAYFAPHRLAGGWKLAAAALLILVLIPALSVVIAWNAGVHFPTWAQDFAEWARAKEDQAATLTHFLTNFRSGGRLLTGLVVIAIMPAVAEELVFRGVMQRHLVQLFHSRHLGVWVAAALFSAVHLEFFGFVPRLLLGLVLGYLYEWSGNILVPMAAHFTQNAFQLLLLYLAQAKQLPASFNPDSTDALPWPTVLLSAALSAGLLVLLHRRLPAGAAPARV